MANCCCDSFGPPSKVFSPKAAKTIGDSLDVDWNKVDLEQFRMGLEVELEHGCRDKQTNVTCDDPFDTGRIALAHLKEVPDYYSKLKKIEKGE